LPKYSAEDIKQCYAILHNYVKNKEQAESDKRLTAVEGMSGLSSYTTTSMADAPPVTLRYNIPRGYPYPPYPGIPLPMSMYAGLGEPYPSFASPYSAPDAAMLAARRASYPMDAFSVTKAIPANEYNGGTSGTGTNTSTTTTGENSEHLFSAEYPAWNSNSNENATSATTADVNANHTNQDTQPQTNNI